MADVDELDGSSITSRLAAMRTPAKNLAGALTPNRLKPVAVAAAAPFFRACAFRGTKTYSAMVRVRNEEEFLEPCIESIVDHVDEVVIIDNMSTDATPSIIAALRQRHPARIRVLEYPHVMARYGEENEQLASTRAGRKSPALLMNFYNWALDHCSHPFILKWDGDTVATDAMAGALASFRHAPTLSLWHTGVNLHEDREHLILGKPLEALEQRLFYRRFARYNNDYGYCEFLKSPYLQRYPEYVSAADEPLYVHLKYCKSQRYSNMSADITAAARAEAAVGEPISDAVRATVDRWSL